MDILRFIFICLEVLFLFNVLIFVHELGHFWAARWRGLKAERFAIWFGKPIWKKKIGDVEYALGWIPFGGYVALPQMAPMDAIEGKAAAEAEGAPPPPPLPPVSALDKIIVAFAGPLFSFLLALVFAVLVWLIGRPVGEHETTTTVGYIEKGGPADRGGIKPGDKILEIDHQPVTKYGGMGSSIVWRIKRSEGETIAFKVEREGKVLDLTVTPTNPPTKFWQRKALREVQLGPAQSAIVAETFTNSPARVAGIKPGDHILEINGQKLHHFVSAADIVQSSQGTPLSVKVKREGKELTLQATPEKPEGEERYALGIRWLDGGVVTLSYPSPLEQVSDGVKTMIHTFGALLAPKSDIGVQHLSGAVKILNLYYLLFESDQGWRMAIWFSVVINVNLALLNLLPLPVLDGGHIVLALVEAVRRRPVNLAVLQTIQSACAFLLIGFMIFVTFFDIQDLNFKRSKQQKPSAPKFSPKPVPIP